jgi:hypothetical protein
MKNFLKNMDMEQVKDQISDIKDQLQDLKFRKPWTTESGATPLVFMAIGAGLTLLGVTLYRSRGEVANFCSNCGAELKDRWESSGIKDKAEQIIGKVKTGAKETADKMSDKMKGQATAAGQERYQPT